MRGEVLRLIAMIVVMLIAVLCSFGGSCNRVGCSDLYQVHYVAVWDAVLGGWLGMLG